MTIHSRIDENPHLEGPSCNVVEGCSLTADEASNRMSWIRSEIVPHAIRTVRLERGLAFELAEAPGLAAKLDRLIELERACCSDIDIVFERVASATSGHPRLEVRGIDPDAEVFQSLLEPDVPATQPASRLAKAAGIGAIATLFICCVLPVAAVALAGAAAAPIAGLESLGGLAASGIATGSAAWLWLGRRHARRKIDRNQPSTGCGC